jgi:two-component system, cell cycle response regulator
VAPRPVQDSLPDWVRDDVPRVLLVDDDPQYLRATERLLRRYGYEVLTARGGCEALRVVRTEEKEIDVILLDLYMSDMTGDKVVEELRKTDPFIPVILQSGYSGEDLPHKMVRQLDIQGFHDKSEPTQTLLLWTEAGVKAARTIRALQGVKGG